MPAALLLVPILLFGAPEEPAFTVDGSVRADSPVAGAKVRVYDSLLPSVLLGETRTGEDGAFTVPVGMDVAQARAHPWAPVRIRVDADGYARRATDVALGGDPVEIRVASPVVRRGRLVDGDGRPVPGAFVRAVQPATGVDVLVASDEDGAFAIDSMGPEQVQLHIRAPGFELRETAWESEEPIVLTPLREGGAAETVVLDGRVLDENGQALAGARVTAGTIGAWTDARGTWRLELPRTRMTTLHVEGPGTAPARVTVGTDRAGRLDLRVVPGAEIEGWVVDDGGAPVLGACVRAVARARDVGDPPADGEILGRCLAVAWSGPDGAFRLRGIPPDAERVYARGHGRGSAPLPLAAAGDAELVLRSELPVAVRVVDDTGQGVADMHVRLLSIPIVPIRETEALTDADGWFRAGMPADRVSEVTEFAHGVHGYVEPGGTVELVLPRDHGDASVRYAIEGEVPVDARLVHAEFSRRLVGSSGVFHRLATGRYELIVTAEGFLPETRTLEIERPDQELAVSIALRRAGEVTLTASPGARVLVQTVSGEPAPLARLELPEGSQVVQGFGPGTYRFVSRADGELIAVRETAIAPDSEPFGVDLRAGAASTLAVTVRDRSGTPVEGAALTLRAPGGFELRTGRKTDAEGRATLDALIEGEVDVYAALGDRLGAARITVTPGADLRVVVTLP